VNNKPLIISHRGDRTQAVENTIAACEIALAAGADALEIDVRETGSGELVVFHDFSLKRMFNQNGYVGRIPLKDLLSFPYKNNPAKEPQFIETLDAFFDHFKNKVPINLDAKTIHFFDFSFADKIIDTIRNHNLFDTVWVSCFNPFLLQILKLKNSDLQTGYLFQRLPFIHMTYDLITGTTAWHPHERIVTRSLIKRKKRSGKKLFVWTVNEPENLKKLSEYEIDGIISDNVRTARRIIDEEFP
jgi:glycerophosphoryl diester phosphodiesterase